MPVTVKFDPSSQTPQAQVIGDATTLQAGVMTPAQVAQLNALVLGLSQLPIYTNLTRPAPNDPAVGAIPGVKAGVIWNSDDHQPNYSDSVNWYDASGNLT